MKKIILIITLITFQLLGNYNDFYFFNEAQILMEQNENQEAKLYFDKLIKDYPDSMLITSNYAKHFIGSNYFYLEEYEKAIIFLEDAKYIPLELSESAYFRSRKSDHFQYINEFYIAKSYEALKDTKKAIYYYLKLFKPYFDMDLEEYRKEALSKLISYDEKYNIFYEASYENNFENIKNLNNDEILLIADYLFDKAYLEESEFLFKAYLLRADSYEVEEKLLEALTRQKKYNEIINLCMKLTHNNQDHLYIFYLANAHRRLGHFEKAIYFFKKIEESSKFYSEAQHILGRLYIATNNTEEALKHLKLSKSRLALELQANIYFKQEKNTDYKQLNTFLENNPFLDVSAEYRYKLYELTKNIEYLENIIKFNPNTYYYELALEKLNYNETFKVFPVESYNEKYKELNNLLKFLEQFPDKNLAKIAINTYNFPKEDIFYHIYLRIQNYISDEDFYNAINLAIRNHRFFYQYENLIKFLYPKYYKDSVEYWAKEYKVDPLLVYSIIRQESHFNSNAVSKAAAYGLMQLILPTAQGIQSDISPEELLIPHINTKLGTAYIKNLLNDYNNRFGTAVSAYNGGPHNLKRWLIDENGNIIIDSITFTETRGYVEKVLSNYKKYQRIYR